MCNKREPTKILVFSEENAVLVVGGLHQLLIYRSSLKIADGDNVMSRGPERSHHREITTLVGEKSHREGLFCSQRQNVLVGDSIRGVGKASAHVGLCEPRVRIQQIRHGSSFSKLTQNELDGDAGASDHGLAQHYGRIDLDAFDHVRPLFSDRTSCLFADGGPVVH